MGRRVWAAVGFGLLVFAGEAAAQTPAANAYNYDALGRLVSVGSSNGSSSNYRYDRATNRRRFTTRPYVGLKIDVNAFDRSYYYVTNPDVLIFGANANGHYFGGGWTEGRNPNAFFSTTGYLQAYGDVAGSGLSPLDHYGAYGWKQCRDPSYSFDTQGYLTVHADVRATQTNPLQHYITWGIHEGPTGRAIVSDVSFRPPQPAGVCNP